MESPTQRWTYEKWTRKGEAGMVLETEREYVGVWIVDVKGGPGSSSFEVSVIREDYKFGQFSYGWFGPHKLLVTHNGVCSWPLIDRIWTKAVQLAHEIAVELNKEEGR